MGKEEVAGERMNALVVEAESPLDNLLTLGKQGHGTVRILIGSGPEQIYTAGSFKLDHDHWLVPGMEIPVLIDRAAPQDFEIVWDEIPSMRDLAAQSPPFLADPIGTQRKLAGLVTSATSAVPTDSMPAELADAVRQTQQQSGQLPDTLEQQLAQAESETAPAGKQPAVVLIATAVATLIREDQGDMPGSGRNVRTSQGHHDTVLAVNVPGQQPYAVFKEKLKHPRREGAALTAGIPALVSLSDPSDVEVLWDRAEAAGAAKLDQRLASAEQQMQQALTGQGEPSQLEQAMLKAQQEAIKGGPPAATPGANPQMREMMIQNAKLALSSAPANMRPMLIQQYRMAGIEIDDQGNIVE
jgi:hypothetical protein